MLLPFSFSLSHDRLKHLGKPNDRTNKSDQTLTLHELIDSRSFLHDDFRSGQHDHVS